LGSDIWSLNQYEQLSLLFLALVYLLVATVLTRMALHGRVRLRSVAVAVCLSYAALFIALFSLGLSVSFPFGFHHCRLLLHCARIAVVGDDATSLQSSVTSAIDRRRGTRHSRFHPPAPRAGDAVVTRNLDTTFYRLRLTIHNDVLPSIRAGGGIASEGDHFFAVTGDGKLF
jgi:hypothetical protein